MPLNHATLQPLTMASSVLDYRHAGVPLQVVAKRFSMPGLEGHQPRSSGEDITIVATSGIGCQSEQWLPTIKRLYAMQSEFQSSIYIRHVWVVEWPNHGDAGVVNEQVLKESYPDPMRPEDIGIALRVVCESGLVDLKKSKLVGISHSAGCGGHIFGKAVEKIPFDSLILVEPPLITRDVISAHYQFISRSIAYTNAQPDVWPTTEDAMIWHKARMPWASWHPEVMEVFRETNFRNLPTAYHAQAVGVTPKTYKGQVSASFNAAEELHDCMDMLSTTCASVPVHLIRASRKNFWPKNLAGSIENTVRAYESRFASISVIPNAGHHIPQENPDGLAHAILQMLRDKSTAKL